MLLESLVLQPFSLSLTTAVAAKVCLSLCALFPLPSSALLHIFLSILLAFLSPFLTSLLAK